MNTSFSTKLLLGVTFFTCSVLWPCKNPRKELPFTEPELILVQMTQNEDTIQFVNRVREFVATNADYGLVINGPCDKFFLTPMKDFSPAFYFTLFEKDLGMATCGLAGQLMAKLLIQNGIDAYTYNFGFIDTHFSHIVVLVKQGNKFLVFDPYMNYALLDEEGNNMDIVRLLAQIAGDSLNVTFSKDTVLAEMVMDHSLFNEESLQLLHAPSCGYFEREMIHVRDSVFKQPYPRYFTESKDASCVSFVRVFEDQLLQTADLRKFHEGFALKINKIYGAHDDEKVDAMVDSIIANSPRLLKRIHL